MLRASNDTETRVGDQTAVGDERAGTLANRPPPPQTVPTSRPSDCLAGIETEPLDGLVEPSARIPEADVHVVLVVRVRNDDLARSV